MFYVVRGEEKVRDSCMFLFVSRVSFTGGVVLLVDLSCNVGCSKLALLLYTNRSSLPCNLDTF
jgi:hypothetical protein